MARILKFAKKHKYPLNRSALTYWEETGPSRLDLGKEKYGGPFTEEEVEDVKTFFKLLPVVICMVIFVIIVDQFNSYFFLAKGDDEFDVTNCMVSSVYFINSLSLLATMLIYHIFKPLFDKCLRTMLRRIGFGITLALLTELVWLSVDASGHYYYSQLNQTCIFETPVNFTINDQWEINNLWIILPKVAMGVAFGIALPTTLEFVFAQAPHSMKGLMIGVWFMVSGCVQMIGFNLHYPFILLDNIYPNCTFYYYLTKTSIVAISLVCFIGLAVWYKPRERERHFYPHLTVENFYENDFRRRDSYHQDRKRRRLRGEQVDEIDADTIDIHAYLDNQSKISNLK
jgi:peptide/histidine transporter 3/4